MTAIARRKQPLSRDQMPRISIRPRGRRFFVLIDGCSIRECGDEMDAHHWGKHAFEAVNRGLSTPRDVAEGMNELCRQATAFNLHTQMVEAGATPPDFTLPGLDGLEYALHEATGKGPVVLAFWQKNCGACKLAAPYLNRLYDAYENLTWSFWAIAQNDAASAAEFVRDFDFRPTVLIDAPSFVVSRLYDPDSTPTLYVIEPERGVTLVSSGFVKDDLNAISRRIAAYAGANYVEVAPDGDGNPKFKPG